MSSHVSILASLLLGLIVPMPGAAASIIFPVETTEQLAQAIDQANKTPEADIITLERALYVLDEILAPDQRAALPSITTAIVIRGNGAELRRYSAEDFRIFHVAEKGHLRLERVVLAEGSLGALRNHGKADLRHVQLVDNTSKTVQAIVENYGDMQIHACEVSFNTVAGAKRDAGIIVNWGNLDLHASTFQGNLLSRRYDGVALASSVLNYGDAVIVDVVIAENVAGDVSADGAPQAPLVNLGNGRLEMKMVRERDNLPGETLVARSFAP